MNEILEAIACRRTVRNYQQRQIDPQELQQIIDAGLYAPTAGGRQSPVMLVCQDGEVNARLGRINRARFGKANSDGIHFVSQAQKSIADDDGIISGFYDAPTVITLFAPRRWIYGIHDCTSVAVTMSLAAWSLGIGSCYVSRAEETFDTEFGRQVRERAGIGEEYVARACLCLGYPSGDLGLPKPRKKERIRYIRS